MQGKGGGRFGAHSPAGYLLGNEPAGMAIDFASMDMLIRGGGLNWKGDPNGKLTYTSPSPKYVMNAAGVLVSGTALRCDHDAAGNPLGVLIEEQRTNLLSRSNEFTVSPWSTGNSGPAAPTRTANAGTSPDGLNNASKIDFPAVSGTNFSAILQALVAGGSAIRTHSCYVKAANPADVGKTIYLQRGNATDFITHVLTADWVRIKTTGQTSYNDTGFYLGVAGSSNPFGVDQGSCSILMFGAQVEAGSFPTSYIPTTSAQVTRAGDGISLLTSAFPYSATETSIYVDARWNNGSGLNSSARYAIQLDDGTVNNRISIYNRDGRRGDLYVNNTNVEQAGIQGLSAGGGFTRIAARVKANDFQTALDGGLRTADTSGLMPAPATILRFGNATANPNQLSGHIRSAVVVPRAWSDSELVSRSAL